QRVERMVGTDDLTGLEAKRRFDAAYKLATRAAVESGRPLAVLMMDMDGVKPINDTHGHHMGAYAISEVGKLIDEVVKAEARSCRFGGDEFMAFLPGADRERACELGERIRARVEAHRFERDGIVVRPTISVGVAVLPADGTSAEEVSRRADEALYRAK